MGAPIPPASRSCPDGPAPTRRARRFPEVDAAFAYDEGEGDRTLAYWRGAHEIYFSRLGQFAPDMLLWCERFRIVEVIERN